MEIKELILEAYNIERKHTWLCYTGANIVRRFYENFEIAREKPLLHLLISLVFLCTKILTYW